jgi:hypothetical protein
LFLFAFLIRSVHLYINNQVKLAE